MSINDLLEVSEGLEGEDLFHRIAQGVIHQILGAGPSFFWTDIQVLYMSYGRNYLFGEHAITKCGGSPIGFAGFEYGLWGIGFGESPIGYEVSLSRFKVQGNFLVLCSSTNFVGYSYVY